LLLEEIEGQEIVIRMLKHEIKRNSLPQTLLFYGPEGSGKFLASITLAKLVNCQDDRSKSCKCRSCNLIKKLISRNIYLITQSNLNNTFDLWKYFGIDENNAEYFIRDLKRLLISISGNDRLKKEALEIEKYLNTDNLIYDKFGYIMKVVFNILGSKKGRVVTIDQIRAIKKFLSTKNDDGKYKIVIIDGSEYMNEEASNSFLKISEDTPPNSLIILTAVNKDQLKETIKSRCRAYRFIGLTEISIKNIIKNRFGYDKCLNIEDLDENYKDTGDIFSRVLSNGCNLGIIKDIKDSLIKKGNTIKFLSYIAKSLETKIKEINTFSIDNVYQAEYLLKRIQYLIDSISFRNVNEETALTDFLLNNFSDAIKLLKLDA